MAIDDNTSYELTGAQVKDLASRIKKGANLEELSNYVDATTFTVTDLQGLTAAINAGKAFYWNDPLGTGTMPDAYFNASIAGNTIEISSIPDFIYTGGGNGALVGYIFTADATTGMFTGSTMSQLPLTGTTDQMGNITFSPQLAGLTIVRNDGVTDYYDGSAGVTVNLPDGVEFFYIPATSFAVGDTVTIYKSYQGGTVATGEDIIDAMSHNTIVLCGTTSQGADSYETKIDILAVYDEAQGMSIVFNYYDSTTGSSSTVKITTTYTTSGGVDTWANTWTVASVAPASMPLYTALGENTDGPMTQKAVREALYDDTDLKKIKIGSKQFSSDTVGNFSVGIGKSVIQSGTESVAIGRWAEARGNYSVAIGPDASTNNDAPSVAIGYNAKTNVGGRWLHSVALGDYASPNRNYEVNIGTGTQAGYDGANDHTRVLGGVHAGILGTDAVNVDQLTAAIPGVFTGTDGTTAGASGLVPAPAATDGGKYLKGDGTWGEIQIPPARTMLYLQNNIPSLASSFYIYKDFNLTEAITWDEMMDLLNTDTGGEVALRVASSSDCVFCIVSFEHETEQFGVVDASKEYGSPAAYFFHADYNDQTRSKFVVETQDLGGSLVEMSYGEANAWAKFIAAYQAGKIVYCRASSAANPATGTQGRKAFMAYVNNAENPTEVEFQYVRSVSSKSASQPVDQVFVYKLTNTSGGTWTVESRNMAPKLAAGTNTSVSYSNGTYTVSATDTTYSNMTGASASAAGTAGLVPAPAAGDQEKFLRGDGTWAPGGVTYTAGNGISIVNNVISLDLANANNINY